MKRMLGGLLAVGLVAGAVAISNQQRRATDFQIQTEARNPWNHLRLNNDPAEFRFAIVSDRTGGHRERIFSVAVEQLNLMQPEFVISVGDLIEGGTEDPSRLAKEWKEFQGFINRLNMPFFYVPGNHDISNPVMEQYWKDSLGRPYYHFVYRDVLFLILNSSDPPKSRHVSTDQVNYVKSTLDANRGVRWTLVFLHHPLWNEAEASGWLDVEKLLADRPYTVFCGHVHRYQRYIRNGRNYYQLATTGGGSKVRGPRYGEFDHITWITMKKDGPMMANLLLDGILAENLSKPETTEPGSPIRDRRPTYAVRGRVIYKGAPVPGAHVVFHSEVKGVRGLPDALTDADGNFILTTYTANDGAPAGEYVVTVVWRKRDEQERLGPHLLPVRYSKPETSPLKVLVEDRVNQFDLEVRE